MNHDLIRILAQGAIYLMMFFIPLLWVVFTDRFRRQPSPAQYAGLFTVAAFLGIFLFIPAISIVFVMAILAIGLARLSARYALSGLTYQRSLTPGRLFPGDTGELTLRLNNRKLLPLAWVSITDPILFSVLRSTADLDQLLRFSGGIEVQDNLGHALTTRAAVAPFQSLVRTYQIEAVQRGVYRVGPAHVVSGDPFGLYRREGDMGGTLEIIVYPRVYRPRDLGLPFREALGTLITPRALFEDPTLIAGSREYRFGDPLRRVHWKATARTGELQVRVNDPSTTAQLMIVLNMNTYQHVWQGIELDRMEACIDVTASLAIWALEKDFAVGVRSNGIVAGLENTPRVAPSAHPRQVTTLLEQLARLAFSGRFSAEYVLQDEVQRLPAGGSILFVTSIITPSLVQILTSRTLKGRVSVVYCGRSAAPVVRGVPITLATLPAERVRAVS